ncbi:oxidoreductase [Brevibacillus panacihumi W25]|uniref:Oxidoreductase n=1 Tax=Brevibacillus panacihumi W25 TaxID=1408254 RepID=V6M246_9BACL|nr:3-oxoacyl-ACP reductase family protein [Brevibacillus panacihumi]EST52679.1 oxidoreductase [Brevibacillus panacihumi W25]
MKLQNKVVIVTGAGSGNGRAIALRYFEEGATVVVADINESGANETIAMAPAGSKGMVIKVDVTNPADVEKMVSQTVQEFGQLDILVNNAGIVAFTPFLELGVEEWDRVHNVNLKAPFLCSQAAAKEMIKAGRGGRIINITSVEAHRVVSSSGHCQPHYNSSKGGLFMLTKAIALELASHGITVNAVAPGVVETPFTQKGLENPEVKEWVLERVPAGRVGKPADVANAVVFLSYDESEYITGSTLVVDGGWTIH